MSSFLVILFPAVLVFIVVLPCFWLALYMYKKQQKGRRSPLTGKLLRSPGHTLITQIDDLTDDINTDLMMMLFLPMIMIISAAGQFYWGEMKFTVPNMALYLFTILSITLFFARKLSKRLHRRNLLWLGLDAEMAVGQELNQWLLCVS